MARTGRGDGPPVKIAAVANHLSSLRGNLEQGGFAGSIVLSVLIYGVIFFGPANAQSISTPAGNRADHRSAVSEIGLFFA